MSVYTGGPDGPHPPIENLGFRAPLVIPDTLQWVKGQPTAAPTVRVPEFYYPLELEWIDGPRAGRDYRVKGTFTYASVLLERVLTIPDGFVTDFASIPRVLWQLWPPTGQYGKAAVVHDYLYRTRRVLGKQDVIVDRATADGVLLEAMTELHVSWVTRQIIYRGVRVGGGSSFKGGW